MKRLVLVVALIAVCLSDGYLHYREQQKILALEFLTGIQAIQIDMANGRQKNLQIKMDYLVGQYQKLYREYLRYKQDCQLSDDSYSLFTKYKEMSLNLGN